MILWSGKAGCVGYYRTKVWRWDVFLWLSWSLHQQQSCPLESNVNGLFYCKWFWIYYINVNEPSTEIFLLSCCIMYVLCIIQKYLPADLDALFQQRSNIMCVRARVSSESLCNVSEIFKNSPELLWTVWHCCMKLLE